MEPPWYFYFYWYQGATLINWDHHPSVYCLLWLVPIWKYECLQGTASVVLAGLLAALKMVGGTLAEQTYLFLGAGEVSSNISWWTVISFVTQLSDHTVLVSFELRLWPLVRFYFINESRPICKILIMYLISGWNWYCRTHCSWDFKTGN